MIRQTFGIKLSKEKTHTSLLQFCAGINILFHSIPMSGALSKQEN